METYQQFLNKKAIRATISLYGSGILAGYLMASGSSFYDDPFLWTSTCTLGLGGLYSTYSLVKTKKGEHLPFWLRK